MGDNPSGATAHGKDSAATNNSSDNKGKKFWQRKGLRNIFAAVAIVGALAVGFNWMSRDHSIEQQETTYSQFVEMVEQDRINHIQITPINDSQSMVVGLLEPTAEAPQAAPEKQLRGQAAKAQKRAEAKQNIVKAVGPSADFAYDQLDDHADVRFAEKSNFGSYMPMLLMGGLMVGLFYLFNRRANKQQQAGSPMGKMADMGKSQADITQSNVTFDDVAGLDEAKEEVSELVEFLSNPEKFSRLGGRLPKGVMMEGPPGTGKTLLAKAVAGEAGVPFFSVSGSDFEEMLVGVGASRVRDLFKRAKENSPCIIFIDEIDAVAKKRGNNANNDAGAQTLNAILTSMDGFEDNSGIIVIAATNRSDILDPAVVRSGRFDRSVMVGLPDVSAREEILKVHTRNKPLAADVDLKRLAKRTSGMCGADMEKIANEAAVAAAKAGEKFISMDYFNEALDKEKAGKARKSAVLSDEAKERIAYHEAGHTVMALHEGKKAHDLDKVTIIPRERALGVTVFDIKEDSRILPKYNEYISQLRMAAGGRIVEEIIYGTYTQTAGASGDIDAMSNIARSMVLELGMSRKLGMVKYTNGNGGYATASSETNKLIDEEVKRLTDDAYNFAREVLSDPQNIEQLHKLAAALIDKETVEADEVIAMMDIKQYDDPYEKDVLDDNGLEGVGPDWQKYAHKEGAPKQP